MIRKTLTILSLLGLLFSAGALFVSHKPIFQMHEIGQRTVFFALHEGGALVMVIGIGSRPQSGPRCRHGPGPMDRLEAGLSEKRRWPHFEKVDYGHSQATTLTSPLWSLVVVFVLTLLPCFYVVPFYRHRKRKKLGLCLPCGYNLHGLTEPRCPECGTPFDEQLLNKNA